MQKKIICLYSMISFLLTIIFYRLYYISQNKNFAMVSEKQSSYVLDVCNKRAMIYDCNFKPLVNTQSEVFAAVVPSPKTLTTVAPFVEDEDKDEMMRKIKSGKPFLIKVNNYNIYDDGIEIINMKKRYSDNQLATHIIGYTNGLDDGVCGIEKSYNNFLKQNTQKIKIKYKINARQDNYSQALPLVDYGDKNNNYGVVLTLDKRIQQITENAAKNIGKGAVVVMDAQNGDLKSIVSLPTYSPLDVENYLNDVNSPLINRAFCAYNVGSTYKLLVSCAALEEDYDRFINFKSTCVGCKQLDSNIFKCHFLAGHGTIGLRKALEISCNPYFIDLALNVGPMNIVGLSKSLGFGKPDVLANGMATQSGSLPDKTELVTKSDVANLGFGQGKLMTTPLQIAKMVAMVANDGYLVAPRLVKGISDKSGKNIEKEMKHIGQTKIISAKTARTIKEMMVSVVEHGSGKKAKPFTGGAGGKTASAQTGHYRDADGKEEIVHAWFAGFFPVEEPKYVVVVLVEGGESGGDVAAPVFKEIADGILSVSDIKPSVLGRSQAVGISKTVSE